MAAVVVALVQGVVSEAAADGAKHPEGDGEERAAGGGKEAEGGRAFVEQPNRLLTAGQIGLELTQVIELVGGPAAGHMRPAREPPESI